MGEDLARSYLDEAGRQLRGYKRLGEGALSQIQDRELFEALDPEGNSVAVIVKHLAGNMRSRFTDFLTSDGEKPDRNRDQEFEIAPGAKREDVLHWWEEGWRCVFDALEPLQPADVVRTTTIRGEPHTVLQAVNRQVAHYAYHVGQIVFLAKHFRSTEWQSLSIPRNRSAEVNARMKERWKPGEGPS